MINDGLFIIDYDAYLRKCFLKFLSILDYSHLINNCGSNTCFYTLAQRLGNESVSDQYFPPLYKENYDCL